MRIFRALGVALALSLAFAPVALGDTPGQMLYFPLKKLVGGPFVHGTNFSAYISPNLAWVGSDCQGAVNMGKPVPKYAERIFGHKQIMTSGCAYNGVWYDDKQYDVLPLPTLAIRRVYRHLRVKATYGACHRAHRTVRRGQPHGQHGVVPCRHLRSVRGSGSRLSIRYQCRKGHPHTARKVILSVRRMYGTLAILKFYRRNCNGKTKEVQTVNGIWSRKRPKSHHGR